MKLLTCLGCEERWGVVLNQPDDTEPAARAYLLDTMRADWAGQWELDREPDWPAAPPPMPEPTLRTEKVVWVSETDARWLQNFDLAEMIVEDCWQPVCDTDLPDWFVTARATRTRLAVIVARCCQRQVYPLGEYARSLGVAVSDLKFSVPA